MGHAKKYVLEIEVLKEPRKGSTPKMTDMLGKILRQEVERLVGRENCLVAGKSTCAVPRATKGSE